MSKIPLKAKVIKSERSVETVLSGGSLSNPTWEEYISDYKSRMRKRLAAIRSAIETENLVGTKASEFCNDHYFKLSDGTEIAFTWRAWGDLMQAIVGKREGYMTYYM